jgi:hypothetical protein
MTSDEEIFGELFGGPPRPKQSVAEIEAGDFLRKMRATPCYPNEVREWTRQMVEEAKELDCLAELMKWVSTGDHPSATNEQRIKGAQMRIVIRRAVALRKQERQVNHYVNNPNYARF